MAAEIVAKESGRCKPAFIYGLADPRDNVIRYIGKAEDLPQRLRGHLSEARSSSTSDKSQWLRSMMTAGVKPMIIVIEAVSIEGDWCEAEKRHIAFHRAGGTELLNRTNGGEGVPDVARGPAWRAALSASHKDNPRRREGNKRAAEKTRGRRQSEEHRAKIGAAHRGRKLSPEHAAKISAAQKGRPAHPNSTAAARLALLGRPVSEETKAKKRLAMVAHREAFSEQQRLRWKDPEYRNRVVQNMRGKVTPTDVREKLGKASRRGWADEQVRNRRMEGLKASAATAESRERCRETAKRLWADPVFRQKMMAARSRSRSAQ